MKILIKRGKRSRTEHGYVLDEKPQYVAVCDTIHKNDIKHVITIPFKKYIHPGNEGKICNYCGGFYEVALDTIEPPCCKYCNK